MNVRARVHLHLEVAALGVSTWFAKTSLVMRGRAGLSNQVPTPRTAQRAQKGSGLVRANHLWLFFAVTIAILCASRAPPEVAAAARSVSTWLGCR